MSCGAEKYSLPLTPKQGAPGVSPVWATHTLLLWLSQIAVVSLMGGGGGPCPSWSWGLATTAAGALVDRVIVCWLWGLAELQGCVGPSEWAALGISRLERRFQKGSCQTLDQLGRTNYQKLLPPASQPPGRSPTASCLCYLCHFQSSACPPVSK